MKKWTFPILLGLAAVACEASFSLMLLLSAPAGQRWLGDTIEFPSDIAVYLSYIQQGADGHFILHNLYVTGPHAGRLNAVWSTLGLVARTGIPPLIIHELARWFFTMILALVVVAAARAVTSRERDARLAAALSFLGVSAGWLYSIWLGAWHLWAPRVDAAADVASEFSVGATLIGGAHVILSMALLISGVRFLWTGYADRNLRNTWIGAACFSLLLLFHPYFVPFAGVFALVCVIANRMQRVTRESLKRHACFILMFVPAAAVYIPLAFDQAFRNQQLVVNILPLAPALSWVGTLAPFVVALGWRIHKRIALKKEERWIIAWLISAIICIILPINWKRKYIEGFGVALVLLSLPAWVALRDWVWSKKPKWLAALNASMLLLAAGLSPLHLLASQAVWATDPSLRIWFYEPQSVFAAWNFLHETGSPKMITLSDDMWLNVWIPAYAGRRVWVAHDHETPNFSDRAAVWRKLMASTDPTEAHSILDNAGVTDFITTSDASRERMQALLGTGWKPTFESENVTILERTP